MDMVSQNDNTNAQSDSITIKPLKAPPTNLMAIPDIPERFQKKQPVVIRKPKVVKYIPTTEDSVQFNLLIKKTNASSPLYNTLAEDYFNPIERTDRQWIKNHTSESIDRAAVIKEAHKQSLINVAKIDSLSPKDTLNEVSNSSNEITYTEQQEVNEEAYLKGMDKDIISGILILLFAIVGYVRIRYFKYLKDLFSTIVNIQIIKKLTTAFSNQNQTPSMILRGLFLLNTSVFLYEYLYYYNKAIIEQYNFWIIPISIILLALFFGIKHTLYLFVAYVFNSQEVTKEYTTLSQHYSKMAGIIILPLAAALPYIEYEAVPLLLNIGIFIYIGLYIIQILRSVTLIFSNLASLYYMFLYLCALEILPLIVVYNILLQ